MVFQISEFFYIRDNSFKENFEKRIKDMLFELETKIFIVHTSWEIFFEIWSLLQENMDFIIV